MSDARVMIHPWGPVFDQHSRVLILGTMPSPKTIENDFYYGHPQNLFWKTLSTVLEQEAPERSRQAGRAFLLRNRIALWDVIHRCVITGASDSSIRQVEANDFRPILETAEIRAIFTTGKTATNLFEKHCAEATGFHAIYLPSTSPANCAMHGSRQGAGGFLEAWMQIRTYLE